MVSGLTGLQSGFRPAVEPLVLTWPRFVGTGPGLVMVVFTSTQNRGSVSGSVAGESRSLQTLARTYIHINALHANC